MQFFVLVFLPNPILHLPLIHLVQQQREQQFFSSLRFLRFVIVVPVMMIRNRFSLFLDFEVGFL